MEGKVSIEKRFVVDSMLGKVAKWLRILGFDARYVRLQRYEELDLYRKEGFLLITRNQRWCAQAQVICLSANDPMGQLRELASLVPITPDEIHLLHRCILCNQPLTGISRNQAFGFVPDYVFEINTEFHQCPVCHRIFWPGTHPRRMLERLHDVLGWPL